MPRSSSGPHVAYLLGRYPAVSETFVHRELAELLEHGARLGVLAVEPSREPDHGILPPKLVGRLPKARLCLRRVEVPAAERETWQSLGLRPKDLRRAAWLAAWLQRKRVQLVHVHFLGLASTLAAMACKLAELPLVLTVHARGIHVPTPGGLWALRQAREVLCISSDAARACQERAQVSSRLLPLAIEPCEPTPPSQGEALHVLTVARAVPKKGYPVLRQALERLEAPWRWTVLGATEAELGGPLPGLAALGPVGAERVERCYQDGVDIFALACQHAPDGDRDGVPVALMEAMARAVPVVSTPVGGICELIEHERTGLLVPPEDSDSLHRALARLAASPALRQSLGHAGREHVRQARAPATRTAVLWDLLRAAARAPRAGSP